MLLYSREVPGRIGTYRSRLGTVDVLRDTFILSLKLIQWVSYHSGSGNPHVIYPYRVSAAVLGHSSHINVVFGVIRSARPSRWQET